MVGVGGREVAVTGSMVGGSSVGDGKVGGGFVGAELTCGEAAQPAARMINKQGQILRILHLSLEACKRNSTRKVAL